MAPHSADQDNELPFALSHQVEARREVPHSSSQSPFEILNRYRSQLSRFRGGELGQSSEVERLGMERTNGVSPEIDVVTAVNIIRMAEMESLKKGDFTNLAKVFGFDSRIVHRHAEHLKIVLWLLDAAEKYSKQQYDLAEKSVSFVVMDFHADHHPIERVVACFARDLRERIYMESGMIDLEREVVHVDLEEALNDLKSSIHLCEQKLPFSQISHFTGIQTIVDTVASAERIHFIDIGRKLGSHWILLIDALANRKDCRLEQLKITAVCTREDNVDEAGKLLSSLAESMNFPLVFKMLHSEMYELEINRVEVEAGEVVVLHLDLCLIYLSPCKKNVECLLRELKKLNPHVMVVNDVEADACGSTFLDRFKEALFICSAMFDSQEKCLERGSRFREVLEKLYFQEIISSGVLGEDDEGFRQCRKIDFWREYFSRFGIVEIELSQSSMYQASLMIRDSPCWSSCTLSMNGKSLLIGWNGIPLRFVSAWKFQNDD
ncbi:hypothetical protein C2S51_026404 [Perilla frutescens var. frutescens]|nr:hypothetical protein C2S51_026404 [Perilla frutescens var. frutescens]